MNPIRYAHIAELAGRREPACGSTTVIAVDGPSGAGKTSLAKGLAEATGAAVLHLEDVYPGWRGLAVTPAVVARDVLARIAVGDVGRTPRWDWADDCPGDWLVVPPVPLLILDGVGSGSAAIRPFVSLLIWVEAPPDVRRRRALARDGQTYEPFWDVWAAQETALFAAEQTRAHADLILDSSD